MRKGLVFSAIALFIAMGTDALACGDKYLTVGRGTRFQRGYVSLHPVSIVVLKSSVTGRKDFLSRLKVAGHRLDVTDDVATLAERIKSGKFELVLADYARATEVGELLRDLPSKPLFLPVVDAASAMRSGAEKQFGCLLNAEANKKQKNFLAVIDDAIDAKLKAKPVVCDIKEM